MGERPLGGALGKCKLSREADCGTGWSMSIASALGAALASAIVFPSGTDFVSGRTLLTTSGRGIL